VSRLGVGALASYIALRERNQKTEKVMPSGDTPASVPGRPFEKGNGGRKPGSKNRVTAVAQALLRREETELVRKAIELAKGGDVQMLKFLLDRILPKERSVRVELPEFLVASDAVEALGAIIGAIGAGEISPQEGASLATLVATYARAINVADLEVRLEALERELEEGRTPRRAS
jgi:hypothetical protein